MNCLFLWLSFKHSKQQGGFNEQKVKVKMKLFIEKIFFALLNSIMEVYEGFRILSYILKICTAFSTLILGIRFQETKARRSVLSLTCLLLFLTLVILRSLKSSQINIIWCFKSTMEFIFLNLFLFIELQSHLT